MEDYQSLLKRASEQKLKSSTKDRFEIPQAQIEIQGAKTIVKNFKEISDKLRRSPEEVAKYLFKELATPGYLQNSFLILQATINGDTIQKKIESYVKEFVYCKVCGEPDTKIIIEGRMLFLKCDACGAKSLIRGK